MEKPLEELEQILSRELEIHVSLVQTANDLNKAIKESNLTALQQHTLDQDNKICQIEKLEEKRIQCILNLSNLLGLAQVPSKLAIILEKLPGQWRERLSNIHSILKQKIGDLVKINTSNRILMQEALGMISGTLALFQGTNSKFAQYGIKGKQANTAAARNLINRIA